MATQLTGVIMVLIGCVVGSFGPILLKKGASEFSLNPFKLIKNFYVIGGIFFYALGTIIFIPALRYGELSVLYPLVGSSYIFVTIYSIFLLREKMNKFKWMGIFLLVLGVVFIGLGS